MTQQNSSDYKLTRYRIDKIEKSLEKYTTRIEDKLDSFPDHFAHKDELIELKVELDTKIDKTLARLEKIETQKRTAQNITTTILYCSLITNLFAVYEIFFK